MEEPKIQKAIAFVKALETLCKEHGFDIGDFGYDTDPYFEGDGEVYSFRWPPDAARFEKDLRADLARKPAPLTEMEKRIIKRMMEPSPWMKLLQGGEIK